MSPPSIPPEHEAQAPDARHSLGGILGRMRFAQKFALVGLLFMAPIAVLLVPSLAREFAVVDHSIGDRKDLRVTQQAWVALGALGTEDAPQALQNLQALLADAGDDRIPLAEQALTQLADPEAAPWAVADALLDTISSLADRTMINEVGEPSTYYLTDIATKRLPRILAEIRRSTIADQLSSASRTAVERRSVALADLKWSRAKLALSALWRSHPTIARALEPSTRALDHALREWSAAPEDAQRARSAKASVDAFFHHCAALLDEALADRVAAARTRAVAMTAGTGISLFLAVGVLGAVARSVRRSVTTLRDTTARLEAGDYDARVRAWSADELADVADAFNGIVAQLRTHRDDALAESATRAAAEARANQSLQRLRQMADAIPAVVFETDATGQPTFLSAGWEQLTGTSPLGCTYQTWLELIHPDDRAAADTAFTEAIARRRPNAARYRVRRPDGAHRWTFTTSRPRFDAQGAYLGTVGCMIDIHEQIEASEALDSERLRLQTACSGAGIGVWELHMPSRNLSWSGMMFGLLRSDPARFMGTLDDFNACVDPADLPAIRKEIDRTLATGAPGSIRFRLADREEGQRTIAGSWIVVPDATGHRLIGVNWDMTDQLESNRRLERQASDLAEARDAAQAASSAKSEFLANMSHEIRTPIAAIVGYAELLLDDHLETAERRHCALTIQRNSQHLLGLVNDILDLSKIEAGSFSAEAIPTPVRQLIADVDALMRVRANESRIALRTTIDPRTPAAIRSDPTRLRQILLNLLGNAIKFTPAGEVHLDVAPEGSSLRFSVRDTGVGMSTDELARIFRPFTQADSSTTRKFGGTGLGLTICLRLAQLLQGRIDVKSTPGLGSTFTLTIPAEPVPLEHVEPPASPSSTNPTPTLNARILLVDDGIDNQRLYATHLRRAGAAVDIADNGLVALDAAARAHENNQPYDVILMDMQMPEMDGYAATAELKRLGISTPVIALTAHAMNGDRERCLAAGCDDFLTKPVDRRTLIETLRRWVGLSPPVAPSTPASHPAR